MTQPVTSDRNFPDEALDRVFHALSDRTRRALVARLLEGPASVKELAEPFPVTLPAIGKHLRVLEAAGLMHREIGGARTSVR
jgi:DNA-binding transcriptional ArsR family regulator